MKNLILVFVAVIGFAVIPTNAQPPFGDAPPKDGPRDGRRPDGPPHSDGLHFGSPISLFKKTALLERNKVVKKHLSLTDEQIEKIGKLSSKTHNKIGKKMDEITKRLPPHKWTEETKKDLQEVLPKYILELSDEFTDDLKSTLDPEQMKKTQNLFFLFFNGLDGSEPIEISNLAILDLTDEQKKSIQKELSEAQKKFTQAMREVFELAGSDSDKARELFKELGEIKEKERINIAGVLTEEQTQKVRKINAEGKQIKDEIMNEVWKRPGRSGPPMKDERRGPPVRGL